MEITPEITRHLWRARLPTLSVSDLNRTVWYVSGLDFVSLFTMPGPDGRAGLVHLRRWRYQDILVRPGGTADTAPRGWALSVRAEASELDGLAARARAHGGGSVEGPLDTPWNTRDLRTVDPDGNVVVFTARRPQGQRDEAFSETVRTLAREQHVE